VLGALTKTMPGRSLAQDLGSGDAGCLPRIGLSLGAAAGLLAMGLLFAGAMEQLGRRSGGFPRVDDEFAAIVVLVAAGCWSILLMRIWKGYRRGRNLLRTAFALLCIWCVTIPLAIFLDHAFREDLLIMACVFLGLCSSILLVTRNLYRYARGQPVETPEGIVNIHCPECGYSMVGLHECRCPECGEHYTVDQLIRRQHYEDPSAPKPPLAHPIS